MNPATEEPVAEIARGNEEDANRAVKAARTAFESGAWPKTTATQRGELLWRIGDKIDERLEEFAYLETVDAGKLISETRKVEVPLVARIFRYYAGWANKIHGETIPVDWNCLNYTLREPLGVVASITPWNFPLLLACWKIAPALATGNTVIAKPASETPLTLLKLAEVFQEVGAPPGIFNVVTGPGSRLGMALVRHPDVAKIGFTGETSTGITIMQEAAKTLKRVTLELGGKSPNIVLDDADVDAAVRGAQIGIFYNKGEVCAAGSRLLVHEHLHDELMEKLVARTKKLTPGDPLDPNTRFGPLASKTQLAKVEEYVASGRSEGAELVAGGARAGAGKGYYYLPTIFDRCKNDMRIAREEIFGPVLATIPFGDLDEAAAIANETKYGLAAAVWTKDGKKAHKLARLLKAGTVWINTYNLYDAASPFGGYKESGFGRELGVHAIEHYTQTKSVWYSLD